MTGSPCNMIVVWVGTGNNSWTEAPKTAAEPAGENLKDLRIADVKPLDMAIENGKVDAFRARIHVSFK